MIDITMTAIVLRPEILNKTLVSLALNLKYSKGLRLIIDVAPAADSPYSQADLWEVAKVYFGENFICRMVDPSLQAEAIKWMWLKSDSEFVLHWEDDWVLTRELNLDKVEKLFGIFPMGIVYFDRFEKSVLDYPGYQNKFTKSRVYNSLYFRDNPTGLAGPPALLLKEYKDGVLPLIKNNECLDITSGSKVAIEFLKKWSAGVYIGEDCKGRLVKDIGKAWRVSKGLKMKKNTPRGVTWVKR